MILHGLESGASIAVTAQRMADVLVERFEAETELLRTVVKRQAEEIERLTGEMDKHTHTGERHGNAVEDAWFVLGDPAGS